MNLVHLGSFTIIYHLVPSFLASFVPSFLASCVPSLPSFLASFEPSFEPSFVPEPSFSHIFPYFPIFRHIFPSFSHHFAKFSSSEFAAPQVPVLPWAVPCAAVDGPRSCARPLKMISCGRTDGWRLGGSWSLWILFYILCTIYYKLYTIYYLLYTIYYIL